MFRRGLSPIFYWDFDRNPIKLDWSGRGTHAIPRSDASTWMRPVRTVYGTGYRFLNANQTFNFTADTDEASNNVRLGAIGSGPFTMFCDFTPDASQTYGTLMSIGAYSPALYYSVSGTNMHIGLWWNPSGPFDTGYTVSVGKRYRVIVRRIGTAVTLFINGQKQSPFTISTSLADNIVHLGIDAAGDYSQSTILKAGLFSRAFSDAESMEATTNPDQFFFSRKIVAILGIGVSAGFLPQIFVVS